MLRRTVRKDGQVTVDGPELRVRHPRTPHGLVGERGTVRLVTLDQDGREIDGPAPILRAITFAAGTLQDDDRVGLAQVDVQWDGYTTCIEAICTLAESIPGRPDIDEVYVLNTGLSRQTIVCDARTGERLYPYGVKVQLAAGMPAVAWLDMSPDQATAQVTA